MTRSPPTDAGLASPGAVLMFVSAAIPIQAVLIAVMVHLPRYFASHVGMELTLVGAVFAAVRLIDIPLDALLGLAIDRTRSRFGRYRVWMAVGAPVFMLALWMVMRPGPGVGAAYLVGWLLVMYLGYSALFLSHLAWAANLAPSYQARSRLFGAVSAMGVAGAMAVLIIPVAVQALGYSEATGVQAMIAFIIVSTPASVLAVLASTREQPAPGGAERVDLSHYLRLLARPNVIRLIAADFFVNLGPGWMAAIYLFYFKDSRGFTVPQANLLLLAYVAAGFAGAPFTAWLAGRISKHRALMALTTVYSLGLLMAPVLPAGKFMAFLPVMALVGAMQAGFYVILRSITGDIVDEARLDTGREWMGLMYALVNGAAKLATALAIFLTYNVLAAVGYEAAEGAVNTRAAIRGLEAAYLIGPVVFVMIAGACFIGYRLTAERHAEIRRQLEARG